MEGAAQRNIREGDVFFAPKINMSLMCSCKDLQLISFIWIIKVSIFDGLNKLIKKVMKIMVF